MTLKHILRDYGRFIPSFLKHSGKFIKNNKWRALSFILLVFLIFQLRRIAAFIENRLFDMSSFQLLYFLIFYVLLFLIIYTLLILLKKAIWLEKHQGLIVVLGILMPIILFLWQQSLENKDLFLKQAVSLAEENNRNSEHLRSVKTDLNNDKYVLFWRNFSTTSYKEYWSYIHLHYSQKCKNLYADLTVSFDCLNNIIQTRNDLLLRPGFIPINIERLNGEIIKGASSSESVLNKIIGECQQ